MLSRHLHPLLVHTHKTIVYRHFICLHLLHPYHTPLKYTHPFPQIAWLNNPEKDKDYSHLQSDMMNLLNMYPGRLSPMAANLFYMAVIGDPLSPEATNMAKIMTTVKTR